MHTKTAQSALEYALLIEENTSLATLQDGMESEGWGWFDGIEDSVISLSGIIPADDGDGMVARLLLASTMLRRAMEDAGGEWQTQEVETCLAELNQCAAELCTRLEHSAFERPEDCLHYLFSSLNTANEFEIAELVGVKPETVGGWLAGNKIGKQHNRLRLVARAVARLHHQMSSHLILAWFERHSTLLEGMSPLEVLEERPAAQWSMILDYAQVSQTKLVI